MGSDTPGSGENRRAERREPCAHPVEMRVLAVLGHNHFCPPCGSVLTEDGPEKVRITSYKEYAR